MKRIKYYQEHIEESRKKHKRWRDENPEKIKAQRIAVKHVPLDPKCSYCDSIDFLERHHPDYDKPLEVITLCKSCHIKSRKPRHLF